MASAFALLSNRIISRNHRKTPLYGKINVILRLLYCRYRSQRKREQSAFTDVRHKRANALQQRGKRGELIAITCCASQTKKTPVHTAHKERHYHKKHNKISINVQRVKINEWVNFIQSIIFKPLFCNVNVKLAYIISDLSEMLASNGEIVYCIHLARILKPWKSEGVTLSKESH